MAHAFKSKKLLFAVVIAVIVALNAYTLSLAAPTMTKPLNLGAGTVPRDFSVYYIAAWRFLHRPSEIFTVATLRGGEPAVYPPLTPYKYLPSFLILVAPLTSLGYYPAFWVFDAVQFALLPLTGLLLYKLLDKRNPIIAFLVIAAVLLLPVPMAGRGLSVSYFMQWAEGQAKVLVTFMLALSFYLAYTRRPELSGVVYALGAFDPRFAVFGLPLFLYYNRGRLKEACIPMVAFLVALNLVALYPGTTQGFFDMVFKSGDTTPFYTPSWIPSALIICLLLVNAKGLIKQLIIDLHTVNDALRKPKALKQPSPQL